jgi:hypothetical protein
MGFWEKNILKSGRLKRFTTVMPAIMLTSLLAVPVAWAGKLLDELQVTDTLTQVTNPCCPVRPFAWSAW